MRKVLKERIIFVVPLLLLIIGWSNTARAASTLLDYHIRVHQASMEISSLLGTTDEGYRAYQERVDSTLYNVRSMLPQAEAVELDKKMVEVNNAWLHYEINEFKKLQSYDKKREGILRQIAERLSALDTRLTELDGKTLTNEQSSTRFPVSDKPNQSQTKPEMPQGQSSGQTVEQETTTTNKMPSKEGNQNPNQAEQGTTTNQTPNQTEQGTTTNQSPNQTSGSPSTQTPTQSPNDSVQGKSAKDKEAEKAKMNEILHRDEYSKEPPKESALERLYNWLFKGSEPKKKEAPKQVKGITPLATIIQYLVIGIAFAAIAFVLYKLVPRFLRRERKPKKEKRGPRVILGETLEEDQTAKDLLAEADQLARAGDIRGAIRKGYIALLCELGDREVLSLSQYKTNRDYLRDIRTRIMLYAAMEQMTNSFERHWYGFQTPNENDWNNFRNYYQQAVKN